MKKTLLVLILLLCFLAHPAPAAPPAFDSSGTTAAAADSAGTVWAMPDSGVEGKIRRWRNRAWTEKAVPKAAGFLPLALTHGGGFVYVFWERYNSDHGGPPQCLVTMHRGDTCRVLASFPGQVAWFIGFLPPPTIYAGSSGDVWIAGSPLCLWHISPDGGVTPFLLKPEQFRSAQFPLAGVFPAHSLHSFIDGQSRRWFWQDTLRQGGIPQSGLRGVLIWDGHTLDSHPSVSGVPDRAFSVVASLDPTHVWLAAAGDEYSSPKGIITHGGLYRVDIRTFAATPEPPPAPGVFQNITQIFQANGDWYAVDTSQYNGYATLWRRRAGVWSKIVDTLEPPGGYNAASGAYSWLAEPTGVWIGVSGGAWWLPRDSSPALFVNWRRGVPTQTVTGLFPLPGGRVFAANGSGGAEMPPTPQPVRPLPPGVTVGGLGAPKGLGTLYSDPRHHLWGTLAFCSGPYPLYEWNGVRWRTHLPPKIITAPSGWYARDTLGRLWLTTHEWNPPAQPIPVDGYAVYDPAQDAWTSFATVQDALGASASLPNMALLMPPTSFEMPVFSGDGRVTYSSGSTEIALYDGKQWRRWQSADIMGRNYAGNAPSPPHFNRAGRLEVGFGGPRCEWTPEGGWQRTGTEPAAVYPNPIPPGGPRDLLWDNPAIDDAGVKWFVWHDAVWAAGYGQWVKQAALSAPGSPFRVGCGIEGAQHDSAGRLFFQPRSAGFNDYVVWSPPPVPKPTLSITPLADDAVRVKFGAILSGPHWVRWRLNSGAWSAPTTQSTLTLTTQARGEYRLDAETLDSRLQLSPLVSAVWRIKVAPETQIARWVRALLSGPDPARETAIAGLAKQPAAALPALQAARPGASDTALWWLDAAIQQVQAAADAGFPAAGRE